MKTKTFPYDPLKYLDTPERQASLLDDAFRSGDAAYISAALGAVAKVRGMSEVARGAKVTREALYKALTRTGDPKLTTLMGVLSTLDMRVSVSSIAKPKRPKKGARVARAA